MIWIRADANQTIGLGHVMRCLSIAEAIKNLQKEVCFLVSSEDATGLLSEHLMSYKVLHTAYNQMEEELPALCKLLDDELPTCLLIDTYQVTERYLMEVRKHVRTVYLDDCFNFSYPVDGLINYNIYGDKLPYRTDENLKNSFLLLGPEFAPLREEFQYITKNIKLRAKKGKNEGKDVTDVLITTGGSDQYDLAGQILKEVISRISNVSTSSFVQMKFHVVCGMFNPHYQDLFELSQKYPNIRIHRNVTNMAELMMQCDLAISAGGSTLYELCALGVPFLCFSFVDNQELIVETFLKKGLTIYGGNYLIEQDKLAYNVCENLLKLCKDSILRQTLCDKERKAVDGLGASRIANALIKI